MIKKPVQFLKINMSENITNVVMHKFKYVLLITIVLQFNYLSVIAIKNDMLADSIGSYRTKRQGDSQICVIPNIANSKVTILSENSSTNVPATSYLLLNVTCDHNYILYPPNNNIVLCINGFWDREIPQCIQCGQRLDNTYKPFIVNGTISKLGDFPWHVGIYRKEPSDSHPLYLCGGSIINDNSILTTAHCFTDEAGKLTSSKYYTAAGKYYNSYYSDKDKYAQKRQVARIKIHPRYKGYFTNYAWDIAVIIVDEPFEISNVVQPVCVDWMTSFENEQLIPNNYGEIAGWGSTETNLETASQELRVLKVPFIKADKCTSLVPSSFIRYITPDKFCAGYTNGSSVCGGDSGGGLVFQKEENRDTRFYIRGLVSVGVQIDGRCDDYKYSTYTRVSEYLSFIRESITVTTSSLTSSITKPEILVDPSVPCITPNGEHAKCISIYECNIFVDALRSKVTAEVQKFMRDSQCGAEGGVKVCCGSTINSLSTIHSNPVTTKPVVHRNLHLLPSPGVCGRQVRVRQARIFGGNVTTLLDYPWMVLLEYGSKEESSGFKCTGFLINERYVLTAAHCVTQTGSEANAYRVRLGEYNQMTEIDCVNLNEGTGNLPNGEKCADQPIDVDIKTKIVHPLYNKVLRTLTDNIALLRLTSKINYTDFIRPICLPLNGENSLPGKQLVIAGWGKTENGHNSPIKRKAFVPVVSYEECAKIYKEAAKIQLGISQVCFGGEEIDACAGDSGGPLMSTLTDSRDMYAEGIISFGSRNCGAKGFPTVATKVSEYIEWILDNIEP